MIERQVYYPWAGSANDDHPYGSQGLQFAEREMVHKVVQMVRQKGCLRLLALL